MNAFVGQPISRVDGPAKVTGQAIYAAEFKLQNMAHAALVHSTIAKGRITGIDASAAERAPGVLAVITHENADRLPYRALEKRPPVDPKAGDQLRVFQGADVLFFGQPVAVVVAETPEEARSAAALVRTKYQPEPAVTHMQPDRARPPSSASAKAGRPGEAGRGDAEAAFAAAPVKIDMRCSHEREHHNAMEPHATIAQWDGDQLTLYDKSQWVDNVRMEIAHVFGIPEGNIRVVSPFVGGAFGSALRTWPHVTVAALAARRLHRPVRLELTRRELYFSIGYRPWTEQRMALGADRDGHLTATLQEVISQTSAYEEYAERTPDPPRKTYACANVATRYRLVDMHVNSPCPMRAPGIVTGLMALEMAMDELAEALSMDPLELRLRNHADQDEDEGLPWSSKELRTCYRVAAERFGWKKRAPRPAAMRIDGALVGYGMATAMYPAERMAASVQAVLYANDSVIVRTASSDMGPGTYTAMTQLAAETLGLPLERVHFELGDTEMPEAPVHGGSITLVSVGNAVVDACKALQEKLRVLGGGAGGDGYGAQLRRHGLESLQASGRAEPGEESERFSSAAFGAVFAEVRVDPDFGTVRVPRMVGAYDVGRVINPKIARSQCLGGMVGGIGMALLEQAEWDPRLGRVMNANLAEYLVPVNADVADLDVTFVPSQDTTFNPLGAKGLAEIALCGVAPAIANAVYHATGRRVRDMPITPEKLLAA
jgi:xanthine dehydrogenase YagR molybdenum-binding subunit